MASTFYGIKKILLLALLFACTDLFSQKYNFKHFTAEEGLLQTQINSITQDKNGSLILCAQGSGVLLYNGRTFSPFPFNNDRIKQDNIRDFFKDSKNNIWFCSYDGLLKYDGYKTYTFNVQDGLPDNEIAIIREDSKGVLWIGSKLGLAKYDGKFHKIVSVGNDKVIEDIKNIITADEGNLWVSNGNVIQKIHNNSAVTYKLPIAQPRNVIRQLFFDSEKRLWVSTVSGAYYLKGDGFVKFTSNPLVSSNSILGVFETSDKVLWFSVRDNGVIKYDGKSFTQFKEKNGLSSDLIYCIYQDRENDLWFGTVEGLDLFKSEAFIKYDKTTGLPENLVWSVFEDSKKDIWITTDKHGISVLNNNSVNHFDKQNMIDAGQYYGIYQSKDGRYWIATRNGLFCYDAGKVVKIKEPQSMEKEGISNICPDNHNNIWFCSFANGLYKYDGKHFTKFSSKNGMLGGEVYFVFDDDKGNIWISTGMGISIYDGKKFTNFPRTTSLINKEIFTIKKDKRGGIWGASYGLGVLKMELSESGDLSVKQFSTRDGLISDLVYLIEIDDYDNLWVGTQIGLSVLSLKDYYEKNIVSIKKFNKEDGIPHAEYNQAASYKDSKGNVWFGTNKGLIKCDPSRIKSNTIEPTTLIENLRIFYKNEDLSKFGKVVENSGLPENLELPYDMNHVTIEFVGISLSNSSKIQYKYILENFDREWHQETGRNYETYSNLPPGTYTFKLLACNDDGLWNKQAVTYTFTILTPFYRTWWFISFSLLLVVSGSWLAYKLRMRKIQLLNEELEKTLKERIIAEAKLQQSERDYRGLFENAHDAILVVDPLKNIILEANKEACKMYGYSYEEIINLSFTEITSDFEKARYNLLETLQSKGWGNYEIQHFTKSGEMINIEANATVIDYKGRQAIVAIMHNITERKQIEQALIESKEHAEKSNQLKSNFLAQMSHEIRTPINTILSYTSLIKAETQKLLPPELNEGFQIIESGGRRLIRTIDSILNMSQIQSGAQEIFPERIRLHDELLFELFNELKKTAQIKSLGFSIHNNSVNDMILGDHYTVAQLFINLMDNAIKYTPEGSVSVILENRDADSITVKVSDTGIGMSEDFLPTIFQPFSQEEMGYTRHFEGNGLGLALVKSYCDLNKAKIEVESVKGEGTTFSVTFKLYKEE